MRRRGNAMGGAIPHPDACPSVRILSGRWEAGKRPPYHPDGIAAPLSSGGSGKPRGAAHFTIVEAVTTSVASSLFPMKLLKLSNDSAMEHPPFCFRAPL